MEMECELDSAWGARGHVTQSPTLTLVQVVVLETLSLGPRISPLWMIRVIVMIVMEWTWTLVSEEEVWRLYNGYI